jgi:hypothetical protein
MDGINAAIVGFLLVAMAMPQLIKNRAAHNLALATVLINILVTGTATMLMAWTIGRAFLVVSMLLTAASLVLTVMAAGGLTFPQFVDGLSNSLGTPATPAGPSAPAAGESKPEAKQG